MRVLVTGGAGFIGSHLAEYHLAIGDEVRVVDNLSTGSIDNVLPFLRNPRFAFDEADILAWPALEEAVAWAERMYHMAALVGVYRCLEQPLNVLTTNITLTERLLRAACSHYYGQQIILASSSEVYGQIPYRTRNDAADPGRSRNGAGLHEDMKLVIEGFNDSLRCNYPISKLTMEALGVSLAKVNGMRIIIARLFNTIGPRQTGRYGMVVPRFVKQAVGGEPINVYGDGTQCRCFCDVRDVVLALALLASNPDSAGEIINVGHNREIPIGRLAQLVKQRARSDSPIVHLPHDEAYGKRFEETYHRRPCLEKLFGLVNFDYQWTLEATLENLIEIERLRQGQTEPEAKWRQPLTS